MPELKDNIHSIDENVSNDLLRSVENSYPLRRVWIGILLIISFWGLGAYIYQLTEGLITTSLRNYVMWGLYISTFVFYVGISHVGALMSAILRLTNAEWRKPLTRMAEAITFSSLIFAGIMPIIDMGRPDRIMNLLLHGRMSSPLVWDIICILTYLVGSTLFLYIPSIPDIAMCRDKFKNNPKISKFRKNVYTKMALGWLGTKNQWKYLNKCITILTAIIIPVAISVHTVVAWIFALTPRAGWNNAIFGPYFVAGAIMSGAAAVIVAMYVFRRAYKLEAYITEMHFNKLGILLFVLALVYLYFNINEYWVPMYVSKTAEAELLNDLFYGSYAPLYWTVQIFGLLIPTIAIATKWGRKIIPLTIFSLLIAIGAWFKRYLIVVPTLEHPFLPIQKVPDSWANYFPNWVEWSVTLGTFAGFLLVYTLFSRFIPIVSIWEVAEKKDNRNTGSNE